MKRFLLLSLLATVVLFLLRRLFAAAASPAAARDPETPRRGASTELVRDMVCDTFVPRATALTAKDGSRIHYFCSDECRSRHLTGSTAHRAAELAS